MMTNLFDEKNQPRIITLNRIRLNNFKGIRNGEYSFDDKNAVVYGENGTGKTTLMDAMLWVLFGKDSNNRADFGIKTLEVDGTVIPNVDHEVECTFMVNGKPLVLRKNYREKWTKKRGSIAETFTGHETDYFIDDVPKEKSEFEAAISSIIDEKKFQLLTNPLYFNETLTWQERRQILIDLCGDVSPEDVANSNARLKPLVPKLNDMTADDLLKMAATKRRRINKEITELETRISEAHFAAAGEPIDEIKLREDRLKLSTELDLLKYSQPEDKKRKRLNELEKERNKLYNSALEIKNEFDSKKRDLIRDLDKKVNDACGRYDDLESYHDDLSREIESNNASVTDLERKQADLREEWAGLTAKYPLPDAENATCGTCHQRLPNEMIAEMIERVNITRAEEKERINRTGKEYGRQIEELREKTAKAVNEQKESVEEKAAVEREMNERMEERDKVYRQKIEDDDQYVSIMNEIADIDRQKEAVIAEEVAPSNDAERIQTLTEKIAEIDRKLFSAGKKKEQEKRVNELAKRKVAAGKEFEEIARLCSLVEEFIRTKVSVLESRINDKFTITKFKLFETQINGGLTETCEAVFNGVPYSGGLNNAMRINVGMDIINTLSSLYGMSAPVFVDNAESVTSLRPIRSQVIQLVVKDGQQVLKVEKEEE
ncbi:MAG: AAA family ATPase [Negativicoccus succinicivorans]|uniref:ATP-binding protein n=1 Tax=Negativicoccus succinicivorans TaxID=620903 RepID=UPI0023551D1B|nr:AAA family ATPase [Negativicoccus succinicivorans]MBS5890564.1 AAA family ATPase [Negativicoccus succinicivorans]